LGEIGPAGETGPLLRELSLSPLPDL
jgi:hypothetical protein